MSWENPADVDFAGVVICYSTSGFPDSPLSGNVFYDDNGTSCSQTVNSENTFFYSAFSYDAMGNYSNSATCKIDGITGIEALNSNSMPLQFRLFQNYPNPFNSSTVISYQISKNSDVELVIYNRLGQRVRTLVNEIQLRGSHAALWNGKNNFGKSVASGVYFYQLKTGNIFSKTQKLLLLK
ncbi:T9SS type A sorting domain-containing protein [candidate division KSB1 bacterium]|nr:T9SS type A sorting domain-containing protein [candidate division KSB1 bacterium]